MKIYDTHSDIFHNLYEKHLAGETDVFGKYHLENLKKGEVVGGIWVVYSEKDFDCYKAYEIALKEFAPYKDKYDCVLGLEGLRNVKTLEEFKAFYDLGIRHAMLTWNEENHLATGVAGNPNRGLTDLGKKFLDFMKENKMIIDVSHLNVKSFYDVINYVKGPVIASHSCCYSLSDHRRNLNDDQLKVLKETGSYVGVNSARNFVSKDASFQNVKGLVNHIDYLIKALDVDHVMLGLDMMDYLDSYKAPARESCANLNDLSTHADCQNIVIEMASRGYTINVIEKICYKNYLKMRKELLGI